MARSPNPEAVTHEAIMAELVELRRSGERGRATLHKRLDAGAARFAAIEQTSAERFEKVEKAVAPLSRVVEEVGEKAFEDLMADALQGLKSLAWLGAKLGKLAKWAAVLITGATAFGAFVKFVFLESWKPLQ
jgi:hypothetical protein